jgi:hypothetical protein
VAETRRYSGSGKKLREDGELRQSKIEGFEEPEKRNSSL